MAEEDEVRHFDHPLPGDGFAPLPIIKYQLYLLAISGDGLVAAYAALNGGDPSYVGAGGVGMAEQALNPCIRVQAMAEKDRLGWRR